MKSVTTNPHGFAITDDELTALLRMIDHRAHQLTSTTTMFEEHRDTGRDALLSAWCSWKGEVPFPIFAQLCITRRMRGTIREYRRWAFPCAPSAPPDAEILTRLIARTMDDTRAESTRELTCDPPEPTGWLLRDVARHWPCLSPTLQRALADFLTEQAYADIARRDGVTEATVSSRHTSLMHFLARHVGQRQSSCAEEVEAWKRAAGKPIAPQTPHRTRKATVQRAYRLRRKQGLTVACGTGVAETPSRVSAAH